MKKISSFIYTLLLFSIFINLVATFKVNAAPTAPTIDAEGVVLLDGTTGQVLYGKNEDTKFEPASTTKVMTALIVLENTKLDDKVTIGKNPPFQEGSSIGLKENEVFTVEELLLGLMLESGNDCALALAEHVSGTEEEFAKAMTQKAKELGAVNTTFKNSSGLHEEGHVTTAHDLALIMAEASKNSDFLKITETISKKLSPSVLDGAERWVNNGNLILNKNSKYYYPYAIAAKKGYTPEAKFTNVAAAKKNGQTLVAAVLKHTNQYGTFSDLGSLLDYGFNNYELSKVYEEGDSVGSVTLPDGENINLLISKDIYYSRANSETNNLKASVKYDTPNIERTSINRGDTLTKAKIFVNNTEIATVNLVADKNWSETPQEIATNLVENNKNKIIISIVVFLVLFVMYRRRIAKMKKRRALRQKYLYYHKNNNLRPKNVNRKNTNQRNRGYR